MDSKTVSIRRGFIMGLAVFVMIATTIFAPAVHVYAQTFEEIDMLEEVSTLIESQDQGFVLTLPQEVVLEVEAPEESADATWADQSMANVDDKMNIRAQADAGSEIVGILRKGDVATVAERGEEWTKISSGNVEGYVSNTYLVFGDEAKALAEEGGTWVATVNTQTLRLREEASEEAPVAGLAAEGEVLTVNPNADVAEGWTAVLFENESVYVSDEFIEKELKLGSALSSQEVEALEAASAATVSAQTQTDDVSGASAGAASAQSTTSSDTQSASAQTTSTEAAPAVEETQTAAVSVSNDTVTLLAAIIMCEAGGEPYEGQVAVGSVIMNRVNSSLFPNTISEVVYQSGQFSPVANGRLASTLASGNITDSCYQAANAVLAGTNNIGSCLFFQATYLGHSGYTIGGHVFY